MLLLRAELGRKHVGRTRTARDVWLLTVVTAAVPILGLGTVAVQTVTADAVERPLRRLPRQTLGRHGKAG
jgi:hypothetical protein